MREWERVIQERCSQPLGEIVVEWYLANRPSMDEMFHCLIMALDGKLKLKHLTDEGTNERNISQGNTSL